MYQIKRDFLISFQESFVPKYWFYKTIFSKFSNLAQNADPLEIAFFTLYIFLPKILYFFSNVLIFEVCVCQWWGSFFKTSWVIEVGNRRIRCDKFPLIKDSYACDSCHIRGGRWCDMVGTKPTYSSIWTIEFIFFARVKRARFSWCFMFSIFCNTGFVQVLRWIQCLKLGTMTSFRSLWLMVIHGEKFNWIFTQTKPNQTDEADVIKETKRKSTEIFPLSRFR